MKVKVLPAALWVTNECSSPSFQSVVPVCSVDNAVEVFRVRIKVTDHDFDRIGWQLH